MENSGTALHTVTDTPQNSLKFIYDRLIEHESILGASSSKLDALLHPQDQTSGVDAPLPSNITLDMICDKINQIGRHASEINKNVDRVIGN